MGHPTYPCDRCDSGEAAIAMWDDNVLCGRIDNICEDCYERGERMHRPIEPPYDEDGELLWHVRFVDCPRCGDIHEQSLGDNIGVCPRRSSEDAPDDETVFEITDDIIVEKGV